MQKRYTIPSILENSFSKYAKHQSLVFVGEEHRDYNQLKREIKDVVNQLIAFGISKGDKVAILSSNMPNWGIVFFAITTMGAVAVPILPDFSVNEISNILLHSESKAIFVSEGLYPKIREITNSNLSLIISIESFSLISGSRDLEKLNMENIRLSFDVQEDDLASIIYTSETTGKSKVVILRDRKSVV